MGESNNPFTNQDYSVESNHSYTKGDTTGLPYKTLNRILDDIKWYLPYRLLCSNKNILSMKPIDYATDLANLVKMESAMPSMVLLNNELPYFKSREIIELNNHNENQSLTTIRGLIIMDEVNHFRIQVLENRSPFFNASLSVSKYEYYVVPKSYLSEDDLKQFTDTDYPSNPVNLIDEVYVTSRNAELNHLMRISIYTSEFTPEDLESMTSTTKIKERYLLATESNSNLNPETIPSSLQCVQKFINVLKGPILLEPEAPAKTINLKNTSLASMIDIDILLKKLGFTIDEQTLIPPTVNKLPSIKESYLRKVVELIYIGKKLKVDHNEFNSLYSFSDNLSLIYSTFNEFDKSLCITYHLLHDSNKYASFIALSCCTFFQDELIIKCFENTLKSDKKNELHYVDYLHDVINQKQNSHKLRTYVSNQSRHGIFYGFSDYIKFLNDLSINVPDYEDKNDVLKIDDLYIISIYETNIESDAKNYGYYNKILKNIGKIKNSSLIKDFLENELIPVSLALNNLGVEEITDDDVVVTAFEYKLSELNNIDDITTLKKSFFSLAVNRKSFILMTYIEDKMPDLLGKYNQPLSLEACYEMLNINSESKEFEVVEKSRDSIMNSDVREVRQALRSYNAIKKSKIITNFLENGSIDTSLLPAENWPAGLDNIGNTCYLNSLLQYYFSIKPIREMVLEFEEHDINLLKERKIGGRKVEVNESKRASQFVYHLQELFYEMIHTEGRCVRPSKDLAYLSFLPASQEVNFVVIPPRKLGGGKDSPILIDSDSNSVENMDVDVTTRSLDNESDSIEEIENPFLNEESKTETPDTEIKSKTLPINTLEMESTIEMGRQQDVTECIENVNFQIESALDPESIESDGEQYDLIKKLFYGKIKQTITPLNSGKPARSSVERFSSLIINISDHPRNIYDALDNYFNADIFELEEGQVKKTLTISSMPDILQFQIQRVLFDRERLIAYKSIEPIPFGEKLFLDRYLETDDKEVLDKREEVFQWKNQIKELKDTKESILQLDKESKLNLIDSLIASQTYLETLKDTELEVSTKTIEYIGQQIEKLKARITELDNSIAEIEQQISNQFQSYQKVGYSVFAVFIHRGEANYGHYWIYIKDPHQKNVFRKYNDEIVTEVPDSEVFNFVEGNPTTPYYIAYVKDELESDYVEPLKRIIKC